MLALWGAPGSSYKKAVLRPATKAPFSTPSDLPTSFYTLPPLGPASTDPSRCI